MAEPDAQQTPEAAIAEPAPALIPDYCLSPNAVFADQGVQWRYGRAPDYTNTRGVWAEGKVSTHAAGSLPELVENLVKNWEVEASFKTRLQDWRTIDHQNYSFAMNGENPQSGEHMLKVGTYNAIIQSNEYYCPIHSDFASSHKTFKRMMPTFAWEVMEVYGGPPRLAFKWRHWGVMKNDYVGFNDKGEKVTAKAHGGPIEIFGVTVAQVNDALQLQGIDTYMDPLAMFRQIAPNGIVNKQPMNRKVQLVDALDSTNEQANGTDKRSEMRSMPATSTVNDATSSSEVQQSSSEVSMHPHGSSLSGTCPFAPPQQMGVLSSTQNQDASMVDSAGAGTISGESFEARDPLKVDSNVQHQENMRDVPSKDIEMPEVENNVVVQQTEGSTVAGGEDTLALSREHRSLNVGIAVTNDQPLADPANNKPVAKGETAEVDAAHTESHAPYPTNGIIAADSARAPSNVIMQDVKADDTNLQHEIHPHPKDVEGSVRAATGEAVTAPAQSTETLRTHEEMSKISSEEVKDLMNLE